MQDIYHGYASHINGAPIISFRMSGTLGANPMYICPAILQFSRYLPVFDACFHGFF